MQDYNKIFSIHIIGVPEEEEEEDGAEKVLEELMAENFPNVSKDINLRFKKLNTSQTG